MKKAKLPKATQDRLAAIHINYFNTLLRIRNSAETQMEQLFGVTEEPAGNLELYPDTVYRTPGKPGHSAFQSEETHYLYHQLSEALQKDADFLVMLREQHNAIVSTLLETEEINQNK